MRVRLSSLDYKILHIILDFISHNLSWVRNKADQNIQNIHLSFNKTMANPGEGISSIVVKHLLKSVGKVNIDNSQYFKIHLLPLFGI